ncbi:MAG: DsbA family protein [Pseudomonadota bacterium]
MRDQTEPMKTIEAFYSAHSAYAYIGVAKLHEIADAHGAVVVHRPFDLRGLLDALGGAVGHVSPAHRAYYFGREIDRWAEYRGVQILPDAPATHANDYTRAHHMIIAAAAPDGTGADADRLAAAYLREHWVRGADLADHATLAAIARSVGLDAEALSAAADQPEVAARHARNSADAIARPIFGSPTYIVDGDMFYGQDRLELVARALETPFNGASSADTSG